MTAHNPDNTVARVAFYVDSNGDGLLNPAVDALLGYGTRNADGTWSLPVSTAGWAARSYRLFARAEDSYGVLGDPLALSITVR